MGENNNGNIRNKKIYQAIVIAIVLIVIILGIGLYSKFINENIETETTEYSNLDIDEDLLNIFYLNVGQADSTFITINGYNMLIDSGNDSDGYYIAEFLKAQNVNKIDYFILTHYDEDHIGGAYKILEEEELEIGILYMPDVTSETDTYEKLLQTIEDNNINSDTTLVASNDIIYNLGKAYWKVLSADNNSTDANDSSIVIELYYGDTNFLFMGDATTNVEENSNISWDEVDVLKVGHHGSKTSTSQNFLNRLNPKYAIISVGYNRYNHPDSEVITRLQNLESIIEIYRTDEDGTIWITSNRNEITPTLLDYNLDGTGRKQSNIFERRLLAFFFCVNDMI